MTDHDMASGALALTEEMWAALAGDHDLIGQLDFTNLGAAPGVFPAADFAAASVAAAGLAVAELAAELSGAPPRITVDQRLAAFWFASSVRPLGWRPPPPWDPVAGDYHARDGWIRLHTNAPRHCQAALTVLGAPEDKAAVADAVAGWTVDDLETQVVQAGGCAAAMRSIEAWRAHPQGRAVANEPLIAIERRPAPAFPDWTPTQARPLAGLKVLDMTRILAGPVATRFLAGFGAQVLRLDPPDWEEASLAPEVTLGKRCARLDLKTAEGRSRFEQLLSEADLLVHGYRPDAMEDLGLGAQARRGFAPDLIEVTLDAYGWTGPWAGRRGFDSLVQMSAGIAEAGMSRTGAAAPKPLPFQALDHATGYLMAAAAVRAVLARAKGEGAASVRLSLARTAQALIETPAAEPLPALAPETPADWTDQVEHTTWGEARRLRPPLHL